MRTSRSTPAGSPGRPYPGSGTSRTPCPTRGQAGRFPLRPVVTPQKLAQARLGLQKEASAR